MAQHDHMKNGTVATNATNMLLPIEGYLFGFRRSPTKDPCSAMLRRVAVLRQLFTARNIVVPTCYGCCYLTPLSKCFDFAARRNMSVTVFVPVVALCFPMFPHVADPCYGAVATATQHP